MPEYFFKFCYRILNIDDLRCEGYCFSLHAVDGVYETVGSTSGFPGIAPSIGIDGCTHCRDLVSEPPAVVILWCVFWSCAIMFFVCFE